MFINKVSQIEENIHHELLKRQLEDKPTMNEDEVEVQLAKPYNLIQEKFRVNIRDLRSLKRDRSAIAHTRRKSDVEQRARIEKARRINMSSDFKYKKVFYTIIDELDAFDEKFH